MKKYITLSIALFTFINLLTAQVPDVTADELIEWSKCIDEKCFDQFLATKNYTLVINEDTSLSNHDFTSNTLYLSDKGAMQPNTISYLNMFFLGTVAGFETYSKPIFDAMLADFIGKKFVVDANFKYNPGKGIKSTDYVSVLYPKFRLTVWLDKRNKKAGCAYRFSVNCLIEAEKILNQQ